MPINVETYRYMKCCEVVSHCVTNARTIQFALGISKVSLAVINAAFLNDVSIDSARFCSTARLVVKEYSSVLGRFKDICGLIEEER